MGWHIHCIENTVKVTLEIVQEILSSDAEVVYTWQEDGEDVAEHVSHEGVLPFNPDHMEHMDYLDDEDIQRILKRNKVKGTISFVSHDGDNAGQGWSYTFDGKGGMKTARGKVGLIKAKRK